MSTQLAKTKEKYGSIKQLLESRAGEIAAALPRHIDPRRMIQVALGALRTNPALLECTQTSLLSAVMSASQLGLELDGVTGQAYLVPYGRDVTLQIGYRGMIDLARRSGLISSISAHVVKEGDFFEFEYGITEKLRHIPKAAPDAPVSHVYAVARFKDGGFAIEVLSHDDVEAIRRSAKSGSRGPWQTHWAAMARKTAIRQLFKYLPISVEVARAVTIDEHSEAGIVAPSEIVTDDGEVLNAIPDSSVVDTESLAAQYNSDADDGVR
jgi:recombination protein RecT